MAKGLHGRPPQDSSPTVINVLLAVALVVAVASVIPASHGLRSLVDLLPWARL